MSLHQLKIDWGRIKSSRMHKINHHYCWMRWRTTLPNFWKITGLFSLDLQISHPFHMCFRALCFCFFIAIFIFFSGDDICKFLNTMYHRWHWFRYLFAFYLENMKRITTETVKDFRSVGSRTSRIHNMTALRGYVGT